MIRLLRFGCAANGQSRNPQRRRSLATCNSLRPVGSQLAFRVMWGTSREDGAIYLARLPVRAAGFEPPLVSPPPHGVAHEYASFRDPPGFIKLLLTMNVPRKTGTRFLGALVYDQACHAGQR